jgi:hypothetical protein
MGKPVMTLEACKKKIVLAVKDGCFKIGFSYILVELAS